MVDYDTRLLKRRRRITKRQHPQILRTLTLAAICLPQTTALHHLKQPAVHIVNRQNSDRPLRITNNCQETIYPAVLTQAGVGPGKSGFRLNPGDTLPQTVSADWKGRVWGRTNCTFDDNGQVPDSGQGGTACGSGDCGQFVECQGAVGLPRASKSTFANLDRETLLLPLPNSLFLRTRTNAFTISL